MKQEDTRERILEQALELIAEKASKSGKGKKLGPTKAAPKTAKAPAKKSAAKTPAAKKTAKAG